MLTDLTLKALFDRTASSDPVPGGGSLSALAAAAAAALAQMVAGLTAGRQGFESVTAEMEALGGRAAGLRAALLADVDHDAQAYGGVVEAFRLPKGTDSEKTRRAEAVQDALKHAARVPMRVAEQALEVLELAGAAVRRGNPNAVTDGLVGAMLARTAILGAVYNVRINLASIRDEAFVGELGAKADAFAERARALEAEIAAAADGRR